MSSEMGSSGFLNRVTWTRLRNVGAVVVGVATVASVVVGWVQLRQQVEQIKEQTRQPPSFTRSLDSPAAVNDFADFARSNNYQVRRIDLVCRPRVGRSCADSYFLSRTAGDQDEKDSIFLILSADPACPMTGDDDDIECGQYWVHITEPNQLYAQVDNGEYGAGNIVARGWFAVSYRKSLGSAPERVQHIYLRAVPPEAAVPRP